MRTKKLFKLIFPIILLLLLLTSCDSRNNPITHNGYTISLAPADSQIAADDVTAINCIVRDGSGNQVGDVMLKFEALDFGYISPEKLSSEIEPDGLSGTLNYDPQGNLGINRIRVWSEEANVGDVDTAEVEVLPYNLEFSAVDDTISAGESTQLYCRVLHPVTGLQTGSVKIRFTALDFGTVPPNLQMSSGSAISGLQSTIFFETEAGQSGTAHLTADAIYIYEGIEYVIGSDTTTVAVQ
jgi:hypothetical protein